MERHPSGNRSVQQIPNNLTRVQASKSSAKIILDDQQTGYLAVVPPDVERDLVSSDARDSDLVKRDSEKDDEQQNDDDDDDDDEEQLDDDDDDDDLDHDDEELNNDDDDEEENDDVDEIEER